MTTEDGDTALFAALPEFDEPAQRRLHARLAAAAGCAAGELLYGHQVHGTDVRRRTAPGGPVTEEDGQATALVGHPALVFVADCLPVLLAAGRLWRAVERRDPPSGWGKSFCAGMMSAPLAADLLDDMRVHLVFNGLSRYPQCVLDRERRAGAVRDDANSVHAEQR